MSNGPTWATILAHWTLIADDLHEVYGIDVEDDDRMRSRSWRWLRGRITGLLERPPVYVAYGMEKLIAVPSTRLGFVLSPPKFD